MKTSETFIGVTFLDAVGRAVDSRNAHTVGTSTRFLIAIVINKKIPVVARGDTFFLFMVGARGADGVRSVTAAAYFLLTSLIGIKQVVPSGAVARGARLIVVVKAAGPS